MRNPTPETLLQRFPALQARFPAGAKASIKAARKALETARTLAMTPDGIALLAASLLLTQRSATRKKKTLIHRTELQYPKSDF
ncbi:hypothetical protein [Chitinilyticum litopenaei]|uniref:hypothetical protein n=1 Tax=Chitinilyticum litopenaei TaxID=1121276 RepID=UPI0004167A8B|nr:hypothetical protein [Chitinilyticum litopenaei]